MLLRNFVLGWLLNKTQRRNAAAMSFLFISLRQYRSSIYEVARGLLRSRNTQADRATRLANENQSLLAANADLRARLKQVQARLQASEQIRRQQLKENQQLRQRPIGLPSDLPLPHHCFGPKMIALCLNLARQIGFRPTVTALQIIFAWLAIEARIPTAETIRGWACRAGVALLEQPLDAADDWIWMADHSNQIGNEKVLQILGIRAADLPSMGQTLSRDKLQVLAVVPGTVWKREDVRREYRKLADRIGPPRFLVCDGAVELHESADTLNTGENETLVLRDFKHFAANAFEKLIGKDQRFAQYLSELGRSRSQIQQTELSHFTPPSVKPKARFMNLGPLLKWGNMVSYHLSTAHSKARADVSADRMNIKLGWVRRYRKYLACWNRCEAVIQTSLKFINEHGVSHGVSEALGATLAELASLWPEPCPRSTTLIEKLVAFVLESEQKLRPGERAWLSTENLESSFGAFKQLEGQQSKGGFTSLVAAMPMLLGEAWTAEKVRTCFSAVSVKQTRAWIKKNLGQTLTSKRRQAYKEYNASPV
jgi:hypothetical protein